MNVYRLATLAVAVVLVLAPVTASAEEPAVEGIVVAVETAPAPATVDDVANLQMLADTVWVLVAGILVMFMQAGFAMVESGFTRAKNAANILMKNLMDFSIGTVVWWICGFGIMFGAGNLFMGTSGFFLGGDAATFDSLSWSTVSIPTKFFFQLVFAATAATIVSGAMAERTKFSSYLMYSVVITALIYPIVGHWIWGGGWLAERGMWDFAGSTVVHSTGAWLALVGAIMVGPRRGKYGKDGSVHPILGHSIPLAGLGVFILWFGWFGFNPGSTMAAVPEIGYIAVTTNLAAGTGAITAMIASWILFKKPDTSMTLNGVLAGLVAITAPCAFVGLGSAVIIGGVAGLLVVLAVVGFDKIRIDDPVGAVSVHGVCGAWGTLAVGLFAQDAVAPGTTGDGLLFGGGASLLIAQLTGIIAVFVWCMVTGFVLFGTIKALNGLRVSEEEEEEGLDVPEHGSGAYNDFAIHPGHAAGVQV